MTRALRNEHSARPKRGTKFRVPHRISRINSRIIKDVPYKLIAIRVRRIMKCKRLQTWDTQQDQENG
jgi:hypothetical protein